MTAPVLLKNRDTAFKWAGEIEDFETEWSGYLSMPRVSASGGTGAWFLAGETASAWDWYTEGYTPAGVYSYLTGIVSGIAYKWTAYNSASGASATAFGTASACVSIKTSVRINNNVGASAHYPFSARLVTNSGAAYSGQRFVQVFYLRVEES